MSKVELGHGGGGRLSRELIEGILLRYLECDELKPLEDAAYVDLSGKAIAITTDSYVVHPIFFPGGDIGRLSVCGTLNDLVVSGAVPVCLSLGFIIEEGFPTGQLEDILSGIGETARAAGVRVVTGDTKVVERGKCDGIYINTTGIGRVVRQLPAGSVSDGDAVIVTGTVGDHGTAIALARGEFDIYTPVESDCAPLCDLLIPLFELDGLRWMRDPTRGGLATVLAELSEVTGLGIELFEQEIPVREEVRFVSEMLGYDPLYLACEGRAVIVVSPEAAGSVIDTLRGHPLGRDASVIGRVSGRFRDVRLRTRIGGERVLDMLEDEPLPRIC